MTKAIITADPEIKTSSILRRYMDLPKLLDLLHSKSLYFRRADGFSDRLEGALFPSLRELIDEEHSKGTVKYDSNEFYRRAREDNYVSCWSIGARDNMALWQLYGGVKSSVAITTTAKRIIENAFEWSRPVHLYKVKYIDHKHISNYSIGAGGDVLQYKSDAYKFESELRMVTPHQEGQERSMGIGLKMKSVDSLVRSIVLAPEADDTFVEAVTDLCRRYGVQAPVRRSKLSFIPT